MDFGKKVHIGERGCTCEYYINYQFDISEANDTLPERLTDPSVILRWANHSLLPQSHFR